MGCFFFLALLLGFQDKEITVDESFRVGYIMLDVVAHDGEGMPVTDLTREDFVLKENRKKIGIEVFQTLDFRSPEEGGVPVAPEQHPIQQTMILLLDLQTAGLDIAKRTLAQLEGFLHDLETHDRLQIFIFSLDKGVISEGFTTEPLHALDDLVVFEEKILSDLRHNPSGVPFQTMADFEAELGTCLARERIAPGSENTKGAGMIGVCLESAHEVFMAHQARRTRKVLGVTEKLMLFLARVDGLKSMYLVSPGFSLRPGVAAASLVHSYRRQDGALTGRSPFSSGGLNATTGSTPNEDSDYTNLFARIPANLTLPTLSLDREFESISQIAMASRVVFHTFGLSKQYHKERKATTIAKGIRGEHAYVSYGEELIGGLRQLADQTGGSHTVTSDLQTSLQGTMNGHRFYYVLGYPMPKTRNKKFRQIQIACKRPGVTLGYRKGYTPASGRR